MLAAHRRRNRRTNIASPLPPSTWDVAEFLAQQVINMRAEGKDIEDIKSPPPREIYELAYHMCEAVLQRGGQPRPETPPEPPQEEPPASGGSIIIGE